MAGARRRVTAVASADDAILLSHVYTCGYTEREREMHACMHGMHASLYGHPETPTVGSLRLPYYIIS